MRPNEIASASARLNGARVLVVEDDFFIGLELVAILSDAGATVVGPQQTLQSALAATGDETLSAAILDIRLGRDTVEPVARRLAEHDVPFLFYTGQSASDPVHATWPDIKILIKPALPASLVAAVAEMLKREAEALKASG